MNDDLATPEPQVEDQLQEEAAKAEGMVTTPDDLPHARIVLLHDGERTDDTFEIRDQASVGRFDAAVGPVDIDLGPLPEGSFISRKHAEIWSEDGKWMMKDLGSSNGTFKMGEADFEKIDGDVELNDGDKISFGNVRFLFELVTPETPIAVLEDHDAPQTDESQ
jgi:pSer/pThr/pTyr-binding forkhead associated (FHA) protein